MKTLFILLFTGICALHLSAQQVFHGKVIEQETGKAIFMAKIATSDALIFTNRDGLFEFPGKHQIASVTVSKEGFIEKTLTLTRGKLKTVQMDKILPDTLVSDMEIALEEDVTIQGVSNVNYESKALAERKAVLNIASAAQYIPPPREVNTDEYTRFEASGFKSVDFNPLSTFSIDVDAASYAIMRRHINNGMLPPMESVRVEEMINYFSYDYPEPSNDDPLSVNLSAGKCLWNENNYLVRVGLQSQNIKRDKLPESSFVFLIDVSGSMSSQNKLPLAIASLKSFIGSLRDNDRIAIVTYAGSTRVVLESTDVKEKKTILRALDNLRSGGSTAGAEGLKLAYQQAEEAFLKDGNNRIILVTDGDFNVGPSSVDALKDLIKSKRDKGIYISILGFGYGNLKDNRMETIADNGNGNYGYVDNLQEAHKILMKEFASNLFVVAKDVKIQVEFNPARVAAYRLVGYENRALAAEDFNNDKKDAGELGAAQQVTALYEISLVSKDGRAVIDPLRYGKVKEVDPEFPDELGTVKIRYKKPGKKQSQLMITRIEDSLLENDKADDGFYMAASVAMFGQLLRHSDYIAEGDMSTVANALSFISSSDPEGYRAELLRLVQLASNL